jgi:hypothetical protein
MQGFKCIHLLQSARIIITYDAKHLQIQRNPHTERKMKPGDKISKTRAKACFYRQRLDFQGNLMLQGSKQSINSSKYINPKMAACLFHAYLADFKNTFF